MIDSVDLFYLSMPTILDIGDGSQDALLVRVRSGQYEGWGECEAAPLVSIASFVCPMSHSACKPVGAGVLGQPLRDVADIARIGDLVRAQSLDLLQADHTLSGIDMAMWDLLGKKLQAPVWQLLGHRSATRKTPYASVLFGDTPGDTLKAAQEIRRAGFAAAKFGWGSYGRDGVKADADQVFAAREGLGQDAHLMVDAGTVFGQDVDAALLRLPALQEVRVTWFEEPFVGAAVASYGRLAAVSPVALAGGEGAHNALTALTFMDHAGVKFIQIDAGRIGGISPAFQVFQQARQKRITYVNHTFTSHLALAASMAPFAGDADTDLCEYPTESQPLAQQLSDKRIERAADGKVQLPDTPGLGVGVNVQALAAYLVDAEIKVGGRTLYRTPEL